MTWFDITQAICVAILAIFAILFGVMLIVVYKQPTKIMYVEDGSLSDDTIEELKNKGYMVVIYRQGSRLPEVQK